VWKTKTKANTKQKQRHGKRDQAHEKRPKKNNMLATSKHRETKERKKKKVWEAQRQRKNL
jgi:hypothetical protein